MRRSRAVGSATALLVVLLASPASAANPVLDPEDDEEVAAALAEATEVQDVCYGYRLTVDDGDTGEWGGTYASSSAGAGVAASSADECDGDVVELVARITYTSSYSEAEDSASWELVSSVPDLTTADVEDEGVSSDGLLDDGSSATTLLNAVLSLPRLASEQAGLDPVVLEPNSSALPTGARPTGTPGSDWLRENLTLLGLCVAAIVAGVVALVASRPRGRGGPPRSASSGPAPSGTSPRGGTSRSGPGAPGPPAPSRTDDPWRRG